jgi:hypothetical protein
MTGSLTKLSGL